MAHRRRWVAFVLVASAVLATILFVMTADSRPPARRARRVARAATTASVEHLAVSPPTPSEPHTPARPAAVARRTQARALDAGEPAEQKARAILAVTRAAYSACDTYEDEGTYDLSSDGGVLQKREFHALVAGPDRVRFGYARAGQEELTLVESDAGVEVTGYPSDPQHTTLEHGVVLMQYYGGFAGPAAILPLLPIGADDRQSALDLKSPRVVGTEEMAGESCDVLEGEGDHGHIKMWISRSDNLVRRITEDRSGEASHSKVTSFHPRCNEPIRDL
jgi:hypothetical protein